MMIKLFVKKRETLQAFEDRINKFMSERGNNVANVKGVTISGDTIAILYTPIKVIINEQEGFEGISD
jgi:hypothetical protein